MSFPDAGNGPYRILRGFNPRPRVAWERACADPAGAQHDRLTAILADTHASAFGRAHDLRPGMTLNDLRAAVPIRTHAELLPWLDRVAAGDRDVLTTTPVRMLLETSGTTGRPKWIPVTDAWARTVADAQLLWVLGLLRDDEALAGGKALSIVSAAVHGTSPGGLPIGSNTGRMFLAQPFWVRWRAPVPYAAYAEPDPELRAYAVLRHALTQPVRSWTTANASTLLLYCRRMRLWWDDLRADCADGTFRRGPAADLAAPHRARLLRGARRGRLPDDPRPAKVWDLRRVCCWTGGSAPFFLGRLPDALGADVPLREAGITASEGFFAVPVDDGPPVAHLAGHVLELVDDAGTARAAHEVEVGEVLRLVITTEAGLLRYDLGDLVRVEGFMGGAPRLSFLRKVGNLINATGEKVTETQLIGAASVVFGGALGLSVSLAWGDVPHLRVAVEPAADGTPIDAPGAASTFDHALREQNVEYDAKRASGRLGVPTVVAVPDGTFAAWRAARVRAGAPDAQVKDPVVLDPDRWDRLVARSDG